VWERKKSIRRGKREGTYFLQRDYNTRKDQWGDSCRCAGSACARVAISLSLPCSRPRGTRCVSLFFSRSQKGVDSWRSLFFYPPHVRDCRAVRSFVLSTRVPHRPPDSACLLLSLRDRVPPVEFVNAVCTVVCKVCACVLSLSFFFSLVVVPPLPSTLYSSRHSSSCGSPSRRPAERMDWAVSCALLYSILCICWRDVIVAGFLIGGNVMYDRDRMSLTDSSCGVRRLPGSAVLSSSCLCSVIDEPAGRWGRYGRAF